LIGLVAASSWIGDARARHRPRHGENHPLDAAAITASISGQAPTVKPIQEDAATKPINPYGWTKLMTEQMLRDASAAHASIMWRCAISNVSGADPRGRAGVSIKKPSHLIKRAVQVAVGILPRLGCFGEDYSTPTEPACAITSCQRPGGRAICWR